MKFHKLMATALLFVAFDSRASLIHHYDLNNSLADSQGGKPLVAHASGQLGATEYRFGPNQGLRLDEKLGGAYTIDMVYRFDALNPFSTYTRILDFKNLASDTGLYARSGKFNLYSYNATGGKVEAGKDTRLTITRDTDKMFKLYQNGELVMSVLDNYSYADFTASAMHFFRDDGGEAGRGSVDYISIYNHRMTDAEVKVLQPPVTELPEPGSLGMMGACLAMLGWMVRRRDKA
jgi:hypothetical protein